MPLSTYAGSYVLHELKQNDNRIKNYVLSGTCTFKVVDHKDNECSLFSLNGKSIIKSY